MYEKLHSNKLQIKVTNTDENRGSDNGIETATPKLYLNTYVRVFQKDWNKHIYGESKILII